MVEQLVVWLSTLDEAWTVFFLSMIPITELRVAIPLGIVQGLEPLACFCYAVLALFLSLAGEDSSLAEASGANFGPLPAAG